MTALDRFEAIIESSESKTNKIKQLLLMGLTRREVADLVTRGNYGFVYNVAKKYGLLEVGGQPTTAAHLDLTFSRNFGIEIEAYGCTRAELLSELRAAGISVKDERYNHTTRTHWKIVSDSSLQGQNYKAQNEAYINVERSLQCKCLIFGRLCYCL